MKFINVDDKLLRIIVRSGQTLTHLKTMVDILPSDQGNRLLV